MHEPLHSITTSLISKRDFKPRARTPIFSGAARNRRGFAVFALISRQPRRADNHRRAHAEVFKISLIESIRYNNEKSGARASGGVGVISENAGG
jgi:hypothetical protein